MDKVLTLSLNGYTLFRGARAKPCVRNHAAAAAAAENLDERDAALFSRHGCGKTMMPLQGASPLYPWLKHLQIVIFLFGTQ
jgi:hypothetical protein